MEPVKERDAKSEEENFQEGVFIHIPVKIRLEALEKVFQQKLVGYIIQEDDSEDAKQFGEILSIHLSPGIEGYDLLVQQEIKMKTMLFSNKIVKFHFQLKLSYNADEQELLLTKQKIPVNLYRRRFIAFNLKIATLPKLRKYRLPLLFDLI